MIRSSPAYPLRMRGLKVKFWTYFLLCLATLNITACDYIRPSQSKLERPPFAKSGILSVNQARDLSNPAKISDGLSVNKISIIKEHGLNESKGLLTTNRLFSDQISDDNERFARLENAVQALTDKINKMAPSVTHLMDIDNDLESLTNQLEILINGKGNFTSQTTAFQTPFTPAPNNTAQAAPSPQYASSGGLLKDIRIADHRGKTRIVFETNNKPNISVAIDDYERIMRVTLNHSNPNLNLAHIAKRSKLIKSITQNSENNETIIIFSLTRETEKIRQGYIPPNKDNSSHRLFIDLRR